MRVHIERHKPTVGAKEGSLVQWYLSTTLDQFILTIKIWREIKSVRKRWPGGIWGQKKKDCAMYSKAGRDLRVEDGVVGVDAGEAEVGDLAPPPLVEEHVVWL